MASRRRKLQRSQSTLTSTSTSLNSNSDSIEATNILSKGDRSSSTASFRRLFDSFRGKHDSENSNNITIVDKIHQYSWKYATWGSKRSKSMTNVDQQVRLIHHNQSFHEEQDKNAKNNFSWSETSGVKIIRSLSDLNQALGK